MFLAEAALPGKLPNAETPAVTGDRFHCPAGDHVVFAGLAASTLELRRDQREAIIAAELAYALAERSKGVTRRQDILERQDAIAELRRGHSQERPRSRERQRELDAGRPPRVRGLGRASRGARQKTSVERAAICGRCPDLQGRAQPKKELRRGRG